MVEITVERMKKPALLIATAILSVAFALLIGAVIILATGSDPLHVYAVLVRGAFSGKANLTETAVKSATLLLTGLSYAFAIKCGVVNLGAEGQLYMGAAFSTTAGIYLTFLPGPLHMLFAILAGFVGGALWGGIVGFLKAKFNVNEIITSLMLNYVAINFVSFLVNNPIKDDTQTFPVSYAVSGGARLPILLSGTRLNAGVLIALACLLIYMIFFKYTSRGYRMSLIGQNKECARYAGFNVRKNMLVALVIGGGFAGLGGAVEILGVQHRLFEHFSVGYGFEGIAAALLANGNPLAMLFTSFLFGGLRNGGNAIQMFTDVSSTLVSIVQSVVIIMVIARVFMHMPGIGKKRNRQGPSDDGHHSEGSNAAAPPGEAGQGGYAE